MPSVWRSGGEQLLPERCIPSKPPRRPVFGSPAGRVYALSALPDFLGHPSQVSRVESKSPALWHARRRGSKRRYASTSVVNATFIRDAPLCGGGQIVGGGLAGLRITNDLIRELLPLAEIRHASPIDGA